MTGASHRPARTGPSLLAFLLCLGPFLVLCAVNSAGYRYGAADQAFYLPATLLDLDPALFPRDRTLIAAQARLTTIDEVTGTLARITHTSLPVLFLALYSATLMALAGAAWMIGLQFYRETWSAMALLAALTLKHAITKSGTNSLESYFHPRQLAFAFGALALAALLRGRWLAVGACIALAATLHPTTALWFAIWVVVAAAVTHPSWRWPLGLVGAVGAAALLWALTLGPLAGRLQVMDPEWLATLASKDYLFPLAWRWDAWLLNLGYIPLIIVIYRHRARAALTSERERGLVIGCLALAVLFALALPFNAARVAIAVQLQIPRVFWMLDFLATVYAIWAIAEGTRGSTTRARLAFAVLLLVSAARGGYSMVVNFPDRPIVQATIKDDDWGQVMRWAASREPGAGWLADPMHAVRYGTSVRAAGQRDVFVEAVKDAAIGMYDRGVAIRTRDRLAALGDFQTITAERARQLAAAYDLDYLVTDRIVELPQAFAAGALRVYRLR